VKERIEKAFMAEAQRAFEAFMESLANGDQDMDISKDQSGEDSGAESREGAD
jgi:hypothetical protein